MHLGDKRAGDIDHLQASLQRFLAYTGRYSVGREDDGPLRYVVQVAGLPHAFFL
jgi:hypothetical protein